MIELVFAIGLLTSAFAGMLVGLVFRRKPDRDLKPGTCSGYCDFLGVKHKDGESLGRAIAEEWDRLKLDRGQIVLYMRARADQIGNRHSREACTLRVIAKGIERGNHWA